MTDNRTTKLLRCPLCGSKAHMCEMESGYGTEYSVCCNYKGCRLSEHPRFGRACKTEAEAIAAWNQRHVETCEPPYDELLRCLENDWHIRASWDGLRKFWCIELTDEGARMRDAKVVD